MQLKLLLIFFVLFSSCATTRVERSPASVLEACSSILERFLWRGMDLKAYPISEETLNHFPKDFRRFAKRALRNYSGDREVISFARRLLLADLRSEVDGPISLVLQTKILEKSVILDLHSIRLDDNIKYGETLAVQEEFRNNVAKKIGKFIAAMTYVVEFSKRNNPHLEEVILLSLDTLNPIWANELMRLGFVEMITNKKLTRSEIEERLSFMKNAPKRPKYPRLVDYQTNRDYDKAVDFYFSNDLPRFEKRYQKFLSGVEKISKRLSLYMRVKINN